MVVVPLNAFERSSRTVASEWRDSFGQVSLLEIGRSASLELPCVAMTLSVDLFRLSCWVDICANVDAEPVLAAVKGDNAYVERSLVSSKCQILGIHKSLDSKTMLSNCSNVNVE